MRPPARDASPRAILATLALVVWVGGFEVAPALHVGMHGRLAAHDHLGTASHSHDDDPSDPHRLDHVARWRASLAALFAPRAGAKTPSARAQSALRGPLRHGLHAAAHRHVAARPPVAALPPLLPAPLVGVVPRPVAPDAIAELPPTVPCARGPPAVV
ncbi:MAG: hypothetical protein H6719_00415 [Sandaracinaceae bacterium]|nr:hypothetical protein [Sandaracinaceae bacterium]